MGHQATFYLTPNDTMALERLLKEWSPLTIIHSRSSTPEPRIVPSLLTEDEGKRWLYYYLVRPNEVQSVEMSPVPARGYWTDGSDKSPIVHVSACFFDGTVLRSGRVYYVDWFVDPTSHEWVEKDESFKKWARSLLIKVKKSLVLKGIDYFGAEALSWVESTGAKPSGGSRELVKRA